MEYLNEIERNEPAKLNENLVLLNAIKKVLLAYVYYEGVLTPGEYAGDSLKNFVLQKAAIALQAKEITDESLGASLRADTQALRLVELGFQEIEKYKQIKPMAGDKKNPAR